MTALGFAWRLRAIDTSTSLWLVGLWIVSASCGPQRPDEPLSEENAVERYAQASCAYMERCKCSPEAELWLSCVEDLEAFYGAWRIEAEKDGLKLDLACLERRLSLAEDSMCSTAPFEQCLVLYGVGLEGEPCLRYDPNGMFATCAQGLFCAPGLGFCVREGVRYDAPTLEPGDQCIDEAKIPVGTCDYATELFCDIDAPVPVCAARVGLGEPCSVTAGCAEGFCEFGVCSERPVLGDECGGPSECTGSTCLDGRCQEPLIVPSGCAPYFL